MMRRGWWLVVVAVIAFMGCSKTGSMDSNTLLGSGMNLVKAATLTDAEVKSLADAACAESDRLNTVAPAKNKYSVRLAGIMKKFGPSIDGTPIDAKVYLVRDVNAFAMANGCVRVFAGLMDLMNDDEVRGVVGHEMGHVALGHTKKAMQTAYTAAAARGVAASGTGVVAQLSQSQLGELTEALVNAQFSQTQELAADDYSFDLLTKLKLKREGLVTAFQKLAKLDNGASSMLSSHPSSPDRAKRIEDRIKKG
jgi:putative metalloprotease